MGKKLSVIVFALVAAQIFSGCYVLREIGWSKDKIKEGEKTKATISLQSSNSGSKTLRGVAGEGRFFLASFAEQSEGLSLKRPIFDVGNVIGQKEKLVQDDALADLVFTDENCPTPVTARRGPGPSPDTLWRTEGDVNENPNKFVDTRLTAKVANGAPGGGLFGLIYTGAWIDDGDGVPEDPATTDDEIFCSGIATTTFVVKGPLP